MCRSHSLISKQTPFKRRLSGSSMGFLSFFKFPIINIYVQPKHSNHTNYAITRASTHKKSENCGIRQVSKRLMRAHLQLKNHHKMLMLPLFCIVTAVDCFETTRKKSIRLCGNHDFMRKRSISLSTEEYTLPRSVHINACCGPIKA